MNYKIILPINGLMLPPDAKEIIVGSFKITSPEVAFVNSFLSDPKFITQIGSIDYNILNTQPCLSAFFQSPEQATDVLDSCCIYVSGIFECLWLLRDSAVYSYLGFITSYPVIKAEKNIKDVYFTDSLGEFSVTMLQIGDLEQAVIYVDKMAKFMDYDDMIQEKNIESNSSTRIGSLNILPYNLHNRIVRAWMFLKKARADSLLPGKISAYIAVLECLFTSIDSGEVNHKVSERVAFYIGKTQLQKVETYTLIKKGYDIRSKYLHGQKLDKKKDNSRSDLSLLSQRLDSTLRVIFRQVIDFDSEKFLDDNNLESWFKELIFKDSIQSGIEEETDR